MYRVSGFSGINYYRRLLLFGYTFVALCQDPFQNFGPWQVNVFRAQGVARVVHRVYKAVNEITNYYMAKPLKKQTRITDNPDPWLVLLGFL